MLPTAPLGKHEQNCVWEFQRKKWKSNESFHNNKKISTSGKSEKRKSSQKLLKNSGNNKIQRRIFWTVKILTFQVMRYAQIKFVSSK